VFVGGGDLNCNRPICGGGRLLFLLGVPVSGDFGISGDFGDFGIFRDFGTFGHS